MRIEGSYVFRADRQAVWKALQDAQTLAATLPGVKSLEVIGPDEYKATAYAGVGSVKGVYDGTFSISEKKDFESCVLRGSGRGGPGSIEVEARTSLAGEDGGGTTLSYTAETKISGPIAGVGQRMIAAAAKRTANEFFGAVDRTLTEGLPEAVAAGSGDQRHETAPVGQVFTRPPAPPPDPKTFLAGVAAGAALVALGVLLGRRAPR
jgi:carbon monoxide dehydrogenase subunit G